MFFARRLSEFQIKLKQKCHCEVDNNLVKINDYFYEICFSILALSWQRKQII